MIGVAIWIIVGLTLMFWSSDKNDNYDEGISKIICSAFWPLIAIGVLSGVALAVIVIQLWIIYEFIDGIDKSRIYKRSN